MRKPVYAICEQQRRRSACVSAQSDQRLCFRFLDSIIPLVSISETSSLYLASVAAQAGLSLPWSQIPKTGFLVTRLKSLLTTPQSSRLASVCFKQIVERITPFQMVSPISKEKTRHSTTRCQYSVTRDLEHSAALTSGV